MPRTKLCRRRCQARLLSAAVASGLRTLNRKRANLYPCELRPAERSACLAALHYLCCRVAP